MSQPRVSLSGKKNGVFFFVNKNGLSGTIFVLSKPHPRYTWLDNHTHFFLYLRASCPKSRPQILVFTCIMLWNTDTVNMEEKVHMYMLEKSNNSESFIEPSNCTKSVGTQWTCKWTVQPLLKTKFLSSFDLKPPLKVRIWNRSMHVFGLKLQRFIPMCIKRL